MARTDSIYAGDPAVPLADYEASSGGVAGLVEACRAQHLQLQYEVSRCIEQLLLELGTMARAADLKHLLQSIETTRREATEQTRRYSADR